MENNESSEKQVVSSEELEAKSENQKVKSEKLKTESEISLVETEVKNEVKNDKDGKDVKKINWKKIGIIFGILIFVFILFYIFAVWKLNWKLPNGCGFKTVCEGKICSKTWDCSKEEKATDDLGQKFNRGSESAKNSSKVLNSSEASGSSVSKIEKGEIDLSKLEEISLREINWLGKAEEVDLEIIDEEKNGSGDESKISEVKYYELANLSDDRKLYYMFYDIGIPTNGFLIILGDKNNYYILVNEKFYNYYPDLNIFSENVSFVLVSETDFEKLNIVPKEIEYKNIILERLSSEPDYFELEDAEFLGETKNGKLYRKYYFNDNQKNGGFARRGLYILLSDGFLYEYGLKDEIMTDDRMPKITWVDGGRNDMNFEQRVLFLGHGYSWIPVVIDGSGVLGDKVKIGRLDIGEDVYQLKGVDNELVKQLWKSYNEMGGYSYGDEDISVESIEEFDNQINHFLMKDVLGDWEIFVNTRFAPAVEMGKPVIYLYPEKEMEVDVRVGAKVRISNPIYLEDGWRDVLAKPNGDLIYKGKNYESLFWEGMGDGGYKFLKNEGLIVRGNEVIEVVRKQMRELGLNEKEIGDFMEFWETKLPVNAKWVRLSWYKTEDLNKIAPLYINPKPDSLIRIFLDWEVVPEYRQLKKQNLDKLERKGFTVVEWGGVLFK